MQNNIPSSGPQNKIYTIVGATGSGKTPFILGGDYEQGLASIFRKKNMSTLVLDEIFHVKYNDVPLLLPKDYGKLSTNIGSYRTLSPFQYMRTLLEEIGYKKLVWNTLLVLEDSGKYWSQTLGNLEKTIIGNSKQQNVDIAFMFWSWRQIPPHLFDMTKYFVIFNTAGGPMSRKDLLGDCYEDCLQAHELIKKGKLVNNRPYYIVETGI